jgi:CRISPR/Cas system-associated endoribonuclease Cas2
MAAYGFPSGSRRSRLTARLQRWGDRIQYSVLICRFEEDTQLGQMIAEAIIDRAADSLIVSRQYCTR